MTLNSSNSFRLLLAIAGVALTVGCKASAPAAPEATVDQAQAPAEAAPEAEAPAADTTTECGCGKEDAAHAGHDGHAAAGCDGNCAGGCEGGCANCEACAAKGCGGDANANCGCGGGAHAGHGDHAGHAGHAGHGDQAAHGDPLMDQVLAEGTFNDADVVRQPGAKIGDITRCTVSGEAFRVTADHPSVDYQGQPVYFCCPGCIRRFQRNPEQYIQGQKP